MDKTYPLHKWIVCNPWNMWSETNENIIEVSFGIQTGSKHVTYIISSVIKGWYGCSKWDQPYDSQNTMNNRSIKLQYVGKLWHHYSYNSVKSYGCKTQGSRHKHRNCMEKEEIISSIWYSGHVEKGKFYLISNLPYFSFEWENQKFKLGIKKLCRYVFFCPNTYM